MPVGEDRLNQPLLSKFAEFVLRFGEPVAEGYENVSGAKIDGLFFIRPIVEESHYHAARIQTAGRAIGTQNDGRKMAGIGVGDAVALAVIESEKKRGVFFHRRAAIQMPVQRLEHSRWRSRYSWRSQNGPSSLAAVRGSGFLPDLSFPLIGADSGMNARHQKGGRDALSADVAHGDAEMVRSAGQEIVVVAADGPRRAAYTMQLERPDSRNGAGKKLLLHFMRDLQFALHALFFFVLGKQALQRFGHGVEGHLQRGQLVTLFDLNAVREVPAIDTLRGFIEIGHGNSDGAHKVQANVKRRQHHRGKQDGKNHDIYADRIGPLSQMRGEFGVNQPWPRGACQHGRAFFSSCVPVNRRDQSAELKFTVKDVLCRWHGPRRIALAFRGRGSNGGFTSRTSVAAKAQIGIRKSKTAEVLGDSG